MVKRGTLTVPVIGVALRSGVWSVCATCDDASSDRAESITSAPSITSPCSRVSGITTTDDVTAIKAALGKAAPGNYRDSSAPSRCDQGLGARFGQDRVMRKAVRRDLAPQGANAPARRCPQDSIFASTTSSEGGIMNSSISVSPIRSWTDLESQLRAASRTFRDFAWRIGAFTKLRVSRVIEPSLSGDRAACHGAAVRSD